MPSFEDILQRYDYSLPPELIAQKPASPRDSAKLLVVNRTTGRTDWTTFNRIGDFLPPRSLLVFNDTRVIPARLPVARATGGGISLLLLGAEGDTLRALAPKKLRTGERLSIGKKEIFLVEGRSDHGWILRPLFPIGQLGSLLKRHGETPIPPYIKESPLTEKQLRSAYQTIFAAKSGSVAAPTASLHFTKRLLARLKKREIDTVLVTLHVHLGTFAPLTEEQWKNGRLHKERYAISANSARLIERAKSEGRPVIAVGTTVARTLESAVDSRGRFTRPEGETSIFIREGYRFRIVDGLITNFHVPESSLLMLVSAFAGHDCIQDLYRQAIERRLRFFSFGDAMMILS